MPFDGRDQAEVFGKIKSGIFTMPPKLSKNCQDFLRRMLQTDPNKRITAISALDHDWIK